MMRKFASGLASIVLALILLPGVANAKSNNNGNNGNKNYNYSTVEESKHGSKAKKVKFKVKNANKATAKELQKLEKMVDQANKKIEQLVKKAQKSKVDDVDQLLRQVDAIVAQVMNYAKSIGATVQCEYTEYYIDGRYVMIDPLRVIRL